jgi:hypothetical protein
LRGEVGKSRDVGACYYNSASPTGNYALENICLKSTLTNFSCSAHKGKGDVPSPIPNSPPPHRLSKSHGASELARVCLSVFLSEFFLCLYIQEGENKRKMEFVNGTKKWAIVYYMQKGISDIIVPFLSFLS